MKKKENQKNNVLNYFLSIGFVLFLTIFLSLIVIMSRFVLSDVTPIGEHVQSTQTLLENIEEVKIAASGNVNVSSNTFGAKRIRESYSSFNELGVDISEISFFNSKEGNSVISLTFEGEVGSEDGVFYLNILPSEIAKGQFIAYKVNGIVKTGNFLIYNDETDEILISVDDENTRINSKQFLGKVFYIESSVEENEE